MVLVVRGAFAGPLGGERTPGGGGDTTTEEEKRQPDDGDVGVECATPTRRPAVRPQQWRPSCSDEVADGS